MAYPFSPRVQSDRGWWASPRNLHERSDRRVRFGHLASGVQGREEISGTPHRRSAAEPVGRRLVVAGLFVTFVLAACGGDSDSEAGSTSTEITDASSAETTPSGPTTTDAPSASEGRIVFQRVVDPTSEEPVIFTVNVDGSGIEEVAAGQGGRWSPDGTEISIFCCDDGMTAHFVDVETGEIRGLDRRIRPWRHFVAGHGPRTANV